MSSGGPFRDPRSCNGERSAMHKIRGLAALTLTLGLGIGALTALPASAAPTVTAVSPDCVALAGGQVTLTGTELADTTEPLVATRVQLDGVDVDIVDVTADGTQVIFVAPEHVAGDVEIAVSIDGGTDFVDVSGFGDLTYSATCPTPTPTPTATPSVTPTPTPTPTPSVTPTPTPTSTTSPPVG